MKFLGRACTALVVHIFALSVCYAADIKPFTFAHISDTHIGTTGNADRLTSALADIQATFPEVEFIINTGDVTEMGYKEEFADYQNAVKEWIKPIHHCVGNHDSRWSESGKENYREALGETYTTFEHKGVRFILLDVAMLVQHYAHFDGIQMARLRADLAKLTAGQPAVLALHHPPLHRGRYMDNEKKFAELIRPFNVPLVLMGHIHSLERYTLNGTTFAAGGSTSGKGHNSGFYRVFRVGGDQIEALTRDFVKKVTTAEPSIPLPKIMSPAGAVIVHEDGTTGSAVRFRIEGLTGAKAQETTYLIDDVVSGSTTADAHGDYTIDARALNNGIHELAVTFADDKGTSQVRAAYFRNDAANRPGPRITREFDLLAGSQAHPTVVGDILFVAANDQMLRAIDLPTSTLLWQRNLNREILSAPVVSGNRVYVASLDKHIYCLDSTNGTTAWKFETGGAILATPLVTTSTVYIGSGDYHLYALDAATGDIKWKFKAERLIKMTPALNGDRLIFGAWDNTIYCLNAADGKLIWKVPASTAPLFSAATSNIATTGTRAIVCTHDYSVRGLDTRNGAHVWLHRPAPGELGPSYSSPVFKGNVAYVGSIDGRVLGFDADSGRKVFDVNVRPAKTDALFDSIPTIDGDKLYIGSVGGNLYCVDIPSASVDWSIALQPGFIFTRPALWNGRVLVASMGYKVYEVTPPATAPAAAD